ncbi:ABC transporter substrate-binding protein [Labrys monachus]|uniref:Peptide/nickel transport system substrate-binding protein n=1 Tax=Labrys monachus TaxID=217067 RepID=A0ABU0FPE7_9HYPH|nr:ABC transporter substrate-binding protein [Labrys monachus]MDQ0396490.1 peptide/nickel transport system substrate-binding protein [Labrys monachus]
MSDPFTRMKLGPSRRQFLQVAAAAGGAAVLPASFGANEAAAQGAGDTLVIAAPATPQGLDIEFDVSLGSIDSLGALYEYMLGYEKVPDPDAPGVLREDTSVHADKPDGMALKGRLAESWEVSPDGRKATFKLREGVKSNWGNTFSSKDVKWTWDRKFNLKGQGLFQTAVLGLTSPDQIKVEGEHAISFNLEKPNPLLLKQQCNLANPIYDATKCAEVGGSADPWAVAFLKNDSAGFGPYRLAQLVRGQQAVFEARDDYWDTKPAMKRVIMREVPQSASRFSLLQGGAVDIAQFLQPRELEALKKQKNVAVDAVNSSYMIWLELNAKIKPFDNVDVRRAVNLALPRDEIIRTIYYGYADAQTAPMPYIYPMVDKSFFSYKYDVAKAKDLLAKAGFGKGVSTTLSYNAGDPTQEPIALLIQTSLRQIGIELTLEKLPAGVFYENVTKRAKPMIFYLDSPWTPDPGYSTYLYFNSKSYVNYSNYENTTVDQLITDGLATLDNNVRLEKYKQVQKTLMDEAPWGFLAYPKYTLARKANLKGYTYYTSNNLRFQDFSRG